MTEMLNCPNPQLLSQLVAGTLSDHEEDQLERHVAHCTDCAEQLNALQASDLFHKEVQAACMTMPAADETAEKLIERVVKMRPEQFASSNKASEPKGSEPQKKPQHSISFACSCGAKLKAREDLRGKTVKCPQCSQPVAVPVADRAAESHKATADTSQQAMERTVITEVGPEPGPAARRDDEQTRELISFLSPPQAKDELGRLGPYRILKILGSGGMGVVYRAEDPHLKRIVALKAMLPGLAASGASKLRFLREAQAAARIKHDHIVTIHQVGEDRGSPYLAMEFLQGESLDERVKREGKLPVKEVLRIGREIADGLDAAHEENLIHRDIKPANVWLEKKKGRVKILDFGLARTANDSAHLTQSGAIVGTPAFMAPEQAKGIKVDHRCDLFSLGCVLYRLATGEYPFKGSDAISTLMSVAGDTPPAPIELDDSLPPELSRLIMHLLAKKADERPASAREVANTIEAIESQIVVMPSAGSATRPQTIVLDDETLAQTIAVFPKRTDRRRGNRKNWPFMIGGGLFAIVMLAIILLLPTPQGTLRVEILDPDVEMKIKGTEITFQGSDLNPVSVRTGEKKLLVTRGDLVFETDSFEIKKEKVTRVKVELIGDKLVVKSDDRVIGEKPIPAKNLTATTTNDDSKTSGSERVIATDSPAPLEFASIFNGLDRTGWTLFGDPSGWEIDASLGVLTATGKSLGWLLTNNDYADFVLKLEYQAEPGANSGVAIFASPAEKEHIQVQISQISGWPTGSVYSDPGNAVDVGTIPLTKTVQEKSGEEWNSLEIDHRSHQLKITINETEVLRINVDEMANRPNAYPAWKRRRGRIGLQSQTNKVRFRNMRIAESITQKTPSERWNTPGFQQWVANVARMSPEKLVEAVSKKLVELNPGFDGTVEHRIDEDAIVELKFSTSQVADISPVRALRRLESLDCGSPDVGILASLSALRGMKLIRIALANTQVADLSPLSGMPLIAIDCSSTRVTLLTPLKGMPLTSVKCSQTGVANLAALKGAPLDEICVENTLISDLTPLRGSNLRRLTFTPNRIITGIDVIHQMKTLEMISTRNAASERYDRESFWKKFDAGDFGRLPGKLYSPEFQQWLKNLAGMSPEKQIDAVSEKLRELNPGFDGKFRHVYWRPTIENGVVTALSIPTTNITDISPVRALTDLVDLILEGTVHIQVNGFFDLSPLQGMGLSSLSVGQTGVTDLSVAEGMPLTFLSVYATQTRDLSPLRNSRLERLSIAHTPITDLSPLAGCPLRWIDAHDSQLADISALKDDPVLDYLEIWGTRVSDLSPVHGSQLSTLICDGCPISNVSPLKGLPLRICRIRCSAITDLSPLEGISLVHLNCDGTQVSDLSPLRGMELQKLKFTPKNITKGIDVIRSMTSLRTIEVEGQREIPRDEFWKKYDAGEFDDPTAPKPTTDFNSPAYQRWMKDVQAMSAENQVDAVVKKLKQLNPGYDGKVTQEITNGVVTGLHVFTAKVTDIAPVRALAGLKSLDLSGNWNGNPDEGTIADLYPLQGMKLERLIVAHTHVSDLNPLRNMPLTSLECGDSRVIELAPLKGLPLTHFNCNWTSVTDLSALQGMPLRKLYIAARRIADLSPLRGMPLVELYCFQSKVTDLSPLAGMPLEILHAYETPITDLSPLEKCDKLRILHCSDTNVADLSPLRGIPLEELHMWRTNVIDLSPIAELPLIIFSCMPNPPVDLSVLRTNKTLAKINNQPVAEFWKESDKQKAAFENWLNTVRNLPAEKQIESISKKLVALNPGFDGRLTGLFNEGTPKIENGVVTELQFVTDKVNEISPLAALTGLKALFISGSAAGKGQLRDLTPLQGVKLMNLDCSWNPIYRLSPLKDAPLKTLIFDFKRERDEELLRSIKTLEKINYKPVGEFWKEVDAAEKQKSDAGEFGTPKPLSKPLAFQTPGFEQWVKDVQAMSAEKQVEAVRKRLVELNPGFNYPLNAVTVAGPAVIQNGVVTELQFFSDNVVDLSPVRALVGLKHLHFCGINSDRGRVSDLSPLQGMAIVDLNCGWTQVSDLSPLKGMPLTKLNCSCRLLDDLSPLRGMLLTELSCHDTQVSDLAPLRGMPIKLLMLDGSPVSDLSPLQGMPIKTLMLNNSQVSDLSPLKDVPLEALWCHNTKVSDMTPLKNKKLTSIFFSPKNIIKGMNELRQMSSLTAFSTNHHEDWSRDDFWKKYDAGDFGQPEAPSTTLNFQAPGFDQWLKGVQAMPAEKQVEAVSKKLKELNPGFDGNLTGNHMNGTPKIENGVVTELGLMTHKVSDLSPLRAFAGLKILICNNSHGQGLSDLSDLAPLQGLKLIKLFCPISQISDLSPIANMPLIDLNCSSKSPCANMLV